MIENLQDELYQLDKKQAKYSKLCANIRWELEGQKCSKTFSKHPKHRICKMKQYLMMMIKQNILKTRRTFPNLQKKVMKGNMNYAFAQSSCFCNNLFLSL